MYYSRLFPVAGDRNTSQNVLSAKWNVSTHGCEMSRVGLISGKVGVSAGVSRENSWHTCIRITRMVYLYKDYHEIVGIVNENDLIQ